MKPIFCFILLVICGLYGCKESSPTVNYTQTKADYLHSAVQQFPEIEKHNSKIILGNLNDDALLDACIQYGVGEGMQPTSQELILVLKESETKVGFYPISTEYCPMIDTIINKRISLYAYDICLGNERSMLAQLEMYLQGNEIKEDTIWTLRDKLIASIKGLESDLKTLSEDEVISKYNMSFDKYTDSNAELLRLSNIFNKVELSALAKNDSVKADIESHTLDTRYEIRINGNKVSFYDVGKEKVSDDFWAESLIENRFVFDNDKLKHVGCFLAG